MVNLDIIRKANRNLNTKLPKPTALFLGGTSGIGRSTLRQLALTTHSPTAYIMGRNEKKATPLLSELRHLNPRGKFHFLEVDVSSIRNVDEACKTILSREKTLDLLFMTPGGISLVGRRETTEGLDRLFALRYYARMRFLSNLLPLLEACPTPGRVVSVLGGGFESAIDAADLELKKGYNILSCAKHSVTMTSLAMQHLASSHRTSFVHVYPGLVRTNIYSNSFPPPVAAVYNYGLWPLLYPFSVDIGESGERHLFHATSGRYPANRLLGRGTETGESEAGMEAEGLEVAMGSNGVRGSGAYLMDWKGETVVGGKWMRRYREMGMAKEVWGHTLGLLDGAVRR